MSRLAIIFLYLWHIIVVVIAEYLLIWGLFFSVSNMSPAATRGHVGDDRKM